jgi:hypothetical protein
MAQLNVPVLVQGYPDDLNALGVARRRDAFCGKISVCNNLTQARIPFTLTQGTWFIRTIDVQGDLAKFVAVCRTVRGLRKARFGAIGARPGAFNTVRYSEKDPRALRHQRDDGRSVRVHRQAPTSSRRRSRVKPSSRRSTTMRRRPACRMTRWCRCRGSASCSTISSPPTTCTQPPSSAGRAFSRTSAATSAPA